MLARAKCLSSKKLPFSQDEGYEIVVKYCTLAASSHFTS